jgi:hypothetical protein
MTEHVPVIKDEDKELPVPTEWRKPLADIVACLASGDFSKLSSLPAVTLEGGWGWQSIERYIKSYGCKLTSLPEESWRTSIYRWMDGYWDVLVDLFTIEEGCSDLVMFVRVYPREGSYAFQIQSVHVP